MIKAAKTKQEAENQLRSLKTQIVNAETQKQKQDLYPFLNRAYMVYQSFVIAENNQGETQNETA